VENSCSKCRVRPRTSYHPWCRPCLNKGQNARRANHTTTDVCQTCEKRPRAYGATTCYACQPRNRDIKEERVRSREKYRRTRSQVLQGHGDQCEWCGSTENIHLHHINGDGDEHRVLCGNFTNTYRDMIRQAFPVTIIPLCATCHRREGRVNNRGTDDRAQTVPP